MKYFAKVTTIEEAKALYRKLAFANHSDVTGGDDTAMKEINAEFEMVFSFLKRKAPATAQKEDTAESYRRDFYTANGWQGDRYDSSLHNKDIAKLLREYVKYVYPTWKFSITSDYLSITVAVMEGPTDIYLPMEEALIKARSSGSFSRWYQNDAELVESVTRSYERKYEQLNHHHIDSNVLLSDFAKIMLNDINQFLVSYTRDDSDAMTDYFNCNLYRHLHIGKWDKSFKVVEKTARIAPTKEVKGAKRITA